MVFNQICTPIFDSNQRRQWHPTPVLLSRKIPWMEEPGRLQSMGSLSPKCLSPLQRNLISLQCLDCHPKYRLTPWWHVWQPCGKASRESHRSLCQLDGMPDTAATAQEESWHCVSTRDSPVKWPSSKSRIWFKYTRYSI